MKREYQQRLGAPGQGFTLLELVIVILVAAVLVAWGFPSLMQSIRNNEVASQSMSMIAMLNLTRSEAIRRNTSVTMVVEPNAEGGWDASIEDPNNEVEVEGCVAGQLRCSNNTGTSVTQCDEDGNCGATFQVVFNNRGYVDPGDPPVWEAQTIFLQHGSCEGLRQRSRIDILPTGQIGSCSLACDSTDSCP